MAQHKQPPAQKRSPPDWSSDLPAPEILESIAKRVASGDDAAAFRAVCSPWRAALPFETFAPLLLLRFGPESKSLRFYSVSSEKTISLPIPSDMRGRVPCGVSRGWLALMDKAASVTLFNPFTGARVELPPADEHVAAASLAHVSKVDGRWVLHSDGSHVDGTVLKVDQLRDVFLHEIVLSTQPLAGCNCVATAVLPNSTSVAFCRVGVDSAWTLLDTNLETTVDCMVHCRDRIYAVDVTGDISILKCNVVGAAPTATPLPSLSTPPDVSNRRFLESNGELHMVGVKVIMFHATTSFSYSTVVYRCDETLLDEDQQAVPVWSKVDNIGDLTLLLSKGFHESFGGASVSTYSRNSVYFCQPLYWVAATKAAVRYQIVDISTGDSEVVERCQEKTRQPDALCWFRPNIWIGCRGGSSQSKDDAEKSTQEAESSKDGSSQSKDDIEESTKQAESSKSVDDVEQSEKEDESS